jgi:hypothetical protein
LKKKRQGVTPVIRALQQRRSLPVKFGLPTLLVASAVACAGQAAQEPGIRFHSSSHLVLVDVVAMKNGLPVKTLTRGDFRLLDNGSAVLIKTFDTGTQATTRPLAIWLVLQCKMPDWTAQGSGFFAGEMNRFVPALKKLDQSDVVGVAHWCDNGDAQIDLHPTGNIDDVVAAAERVLTTQSSSENHDRPGELALQTALQLIVDATRSVKPETLPVVIFLYGDWSGMPRSEADHFIDELLETSAISFGLRDRRSPHIWRMPGEQRQVAHYIAAETGGEYFDVMPEEYERGLEGILHQLHFRYQLGFQPQVMDGKRHKLRVELSGRAKKTYRGVRVRCRAGYVPDG